MFCCGFDIAKDKLKKNIKVHLKHRDILLEKYKNDKFMVHCINRDFHYESISDMLRSLESASYFEFRRYLKEYSKIRKNVIESGIY
jgi:hypothetical protein